MLWFGLTQVQEARAGFDACTRLGGKLFLFQFKASAHTMRSGARRFHANHNQMENLRNHCTVARSVFYVFPMVGTTLELARNPDIVGQSMILDVNNIPPLNLPLTRKGTPRVSGCHYVDIFSSSNYGVIHSDPVEVKLIDASTFVQDGLDSSDGIQFRKDFQSFYDFARKLGRKSVAAIVL